MTFDLEEFKNVVRDTLRLYLYPGDISSTTTEETTLSTSINIDIAQSFIPFNSLYYEKEQTAYTMPVTLKFKKYGTPDDVMIVRIVGDSSDTPTGSTLSTATIAVADVGTVETSVTLDMTFTDMLVSKSKYWIKIEPEQTASTINYFTIYTDSSNDNYWMGESRTIRPEGEYTLGTGDIDNSDSPYELTQSMTNSMISIDDSALVVSLIITNYVQSGNVTVLGEDINSDTQTETISVTSNGTFITSSEYSDVTELRFPANSSNFTFTMVQPSSMGTWTTTSKDIYFNCSLPTDWIYGDYPYEELSIYKYPRVAVDFIGRPRVEQRWIDYRMAHYYLTCNVIVYSRYRDELDDIISYIDRALFKERLNMYSTTTGTIRIINPGNFTPLAIARENLFTRAISFNCIYKMTT